MSELAAQKRAHLQTIVAERAAWASQLMQVKRMHGWVVDVEHLLDSSWAQPGEVVSNATVGSRLDAWREQMAKLLTDGTLSEREGECLTEFFRSSPTCARTWCSAMTARTFPARTTRWNAAFGDRSTQYRRISGRKNWNAYLLRYGRCVAYAAWWEQDAAHRQQLELRAARLDRTRWRELRRETTAAHSEQLTRFRFRHRRQAYLTSLEERWAAAAPPHSLP